MNKKRYRPYPDSLTSLIITKMAIKLDVSEKDVLDAIITDSLLKDGSARLTEFRKDSYEEVFAYLDIDENDIEDLTKARSRQRIKGASGSDAKIIDRGVEKNTDLSEAKPPANKDVSVW